MSEILLKAVDARQYAQDIKTKAGEADDVIKTLSDRLNTLSESFRGAAQQKFEEKYDEWRTGQTQAKEALDSLGNWLSQAANKIEEVDQSLAQGLG